MRPLLPLLDNIRRATSAKAERMLRWRPRSREDAISRHRGESHQVRDRENGRSVGPSRSTSAGIGDRKWRAEQDSNLRPPGFPSFRPTNGILVQQHARLQSLRGCALCTDKLVRPSLVHRHRIVAGGAAVTIKTDHRPSVREPIADVRRIETCVCPGKAPQSDRHDRHVGRNRILWRCGESRQGSSAPQLRWPEARREIRAGDGHRRLLNRDTLRRNA